LGLIGYMKKGNFIYLFILFYIFALTSCSNENLLNDSNIDSDQTENTQPSSDVYDQETSYDEYGVTVVNDLLDGFVPLIETVEKYKDRLRCISFETQLVFIDIGGSRDVTIFQTDFKDASFFVKYKGVQYINEKLFNQFVLDKLNSAEK